ncbi:3-keto-5-aminohexanoate cleavage enzyme [Roseovarius litorisediminis]|uniref:3-keto-5-aminohexanoate cleavage enzyme n=1 Tax=Roseovarius litorisediminis TaxID=1312363 RepID=A0A1Y5TRV3_9RHOB|nr:3-keto-5-aminohexanoate cleavage protein [Roseovarius litorisediminis]SLN66566.1 3-keto-5-aminohexanoate cleavage enzyme [Roseovarius litorisediminis]
MSKTIITCAVTGSIHTPSMSPYLPYKPADIASQAVGAANAGATILHLHARDPENGRPSGDPSHYAQFLPKIASECDAVLNLTTGGSAIMTLDDRLKAALHFCPEMCSLNMGTMNFALYPMAEKQRDWQFDWEEPFLRNTDDLVFKNTPRDIAGILTRMGQERGARFEFECYDISHLYMLRHFADRGLIKAPYFIQFVFGVLGGMGPDPETLTHMIRLADTLFGDEYMFSVLAAGRHQLPMAEQAIKLGGHVRVGLEDNLMIERGVLARSNAQQVEKVRAIIEGLGHTVATPADARAMLGLKGADKIAV